MGPEPNLSDHTGSSNTNIVSEETITPKNYIGFYYSASVGAGLACAIACNPVDVIKVSLYLVYSKRKIPELCFTSSKYGGKHPLGNFRI